jgi:hypothetical protein
METIQTMQRAPELLPDGCQRYWPEFRPFLDLDAMQPVDLEGIAAATGTSLKRVRRAWRALGAHMAMLLLDENAGIMDAHFSMSRRGQQTGNGQRGGRSAPQNGRR